MSVAEKDVVPVHISWKKFGIMGGLTEDTTNPPEIQRHGAQLLWEIQGGATKDDIQKRIIKLLLDKKIEPSELFIFHENSWVFKIDFDIATRLFRRSLFSGRLAMKHDV